MGNGRSFSKSKKWQLSRTTKGNIAAERARFDTTALLLARLLENTTGSREAIEATMAELITDPERLGGVCLSLVSMVSQLANMESQPGTLQALCDWLIESCGVPPPDLN